jgi:BNR repeat-like domain
MQELRMKNKVIVVLVLIVAMAGWFARRSYTSTSPLTFESKPRPVFKEIKVPTSQKPQITLSPSGALYLLAVAGEEEHQRLVLSISHDGGDTFSSPVAVSSEDAVVAAHGENGPSLVQTPTAVYATWQERKAGSPNQIMFARSLQMGHRFENPIAVTDKQQPSFNGFSTMRVAPNGDIYVAWLDGRDAGPKGTFAVYLAKSSDKGASFSSNTRIDLGACPCCRPNIAFGEHGEIYVAWRKVFEGDVRDMVIAISNDAGKSFSAPKKVAEDGWVLHACPDSGPAMVAANGKVYLAWYSEGHEKAGIRLAVSQDDGRSFSSPQIASHEVLDPNHPQLSVSEDGRVLLAFQGRDRRQDSWSPTQIFVAAVDHGGKADVPQALPLEQRSASYPALLSASAGKIFVAWTETIGDSQQVELCRGRSIKD